ncbi:MAG: YceD family protein [Longimicrobiales bacterium]
MASYTTMLEVDLGRLRRRRRLPIDAAVPADHAMWKDAAVPLRGPLAVRLTVEQAGPDVVVRGRLSGEVELGCRRCLRAVRVPVREEVAFLYRSGIDGLEAEQEEVYALPAGARELDLSTAVREHVLLSVPQYAICEEACRGLCPRCGTDLNRGACACRDEVTDERWAALKSLPIE